MIVDGKHIASDILARAKARASSLPRAPRVLALVANETAATQSYLKIKSRFAELAGCVFDIQKFLETVTAEELQDAAKKRDADAVIVQLPLPPHLNPRVVCDAIPVLQDADVLSRAAREAFECGGEALLPPVVAAVREILAVGNIAVRGKKAVVIGEGWLVGKPVATWLRHQGADVSAVTEKSTDFAQVLAGADVIVSGAGHPRLIQPEMIKEGVVLIDAGTSESDGQVVGDADPACAAACSLFTPVPGGVGPIAVACLFDNATTLAARKHFPS